MAKAATIGLILIISTLLLLTPNVYARKQGPDVAEEDTIFLHDVCRGKEKIVKLEVYLHDLRVGNANPTVYQVAKASITDTSATTFGTVDVVDDLLTAGPDINSMAIGRIQGLTTSADLAVMGVALNLNIVLTVGRFNGSTISILGRNQVLNEQRELTVAGGTGAFRFARGYAIQTTSLYDAASFYGVFKFTIYITYNSKFNQNIEIAEMKHVNVILSGDDSGRLMRFDPQTRETSVLLHNLKFPNGVALSKDGDFLLFVETTTCRLYKYWLKPGNLEVVTELPGFPDNIKRNRNGEFWVGIHSRRGRLSEWIISHTWIGNAVVRFLPLDATKILTCLPKLVGGNGMGIRLDRNGNVVEVLEYSRWEKVSEVHEENGYLWIGSVVTSFSVRDSFPISSNFI